MNRSILFALVALIAIVTVGALTYVTNQTLLNRGMEVGIGGGPQDNPGDSPEPTTANLNSLLVAHGVTATNHLQALYDGGDTSETEASLEQNNLQIANTFAQMAGRSIQEEFLAMWRGHNAEYENYTIALKNNDRTKTTEARSMLHRQAQEMGKMINMIIPIIPAQRGEQLMNEHIDLTLAVIEAHSRGDLTAKISNTAKATTQATQFANELSEGFENSNGS